MSNRIDDINQQISDLHKIIDEKQNKYWEEYYQKSTEEQFKVQSAESAYQDYLKMCELERKKIDALSREKRLLMTPTFSDVSDFGDMMPLKEFIDCVNDGGFIDYDGYGHYVKNNQQSDIIIYPSDVKNNSIRKDFDTIIWFNR